MSNPFFNLWGSQGLIHLYFGVLPAKNLADSQQIFQSKIWIQEILQEHIIIPRNSRVTATYDNISKTLQYHPLANYEPYYAKLLYDFLHQRANAESIRDLIPRYKSLVSLASVCINNEVFLLDFPYTVTQYCDFRVILILKKGQIASNRKRIKQQKSLNILKKYEDSKQLKSYLRKFTSLTQFIHYYECDQVTIFELYGFKSHLEALKNLIFNKIGQNLILFFTTSPPPLDQSTIPSNEIGLFYHDHQWDFTAVMNIIQNHMPILTEDIDIDILGNKCYANLAPL
jgi:hypothetical protein